MRTSNLLKCLLTALTLTVNMSCNSDVFIDEFLTETPAPISLTEEASEATISFEADNWDVWSIGSIGFETYPFICDEEGNGLTLPLENGGKDYYDIPLRQGVKIQNWYADVGSSGCRIGRRL